MQAVKFECSDQVLITFLLLICIDTTLNFKNNHSGMENIIYFFYFSMFLSCEEKIEISFLTWA